MFKSTPSFAPVYADYNATAPLRPEAKAAMLDAMEIGANASSVHGPGRKARAVIEDARDKVAMAIGACRDDVVFTSGATEATAMILNGLDRQHAGKYHIFISATEHPAMSQQVGDHTLIPVDEQGRVDIDVAMDLVQQHHEPGRFPVVSVMLANNETGVIQNIADFARGIKQLGGVFICDAVQALGKIPVSVVDLEVDYLILSAHKLGGPQGVGAIYLNPDRPVTPLIKGGGQERMRRSGTENLVGIAGFGAAAEAAVAQLDDMTRLEKGRDRLEARLKSEAGVTIFGEGAPRLAQTSCFALEGFSAETQVMAMDLAGVAISAGSACSSGKVRASSVLKAMGASDELAASAVRISFGWASKDEDFDRVGDAWLEAAKRAGHIPYAKKESA